MITLVVKLLIGIAVLIIAWLVVQRFSPDPLITKIMQIVIFVIAMVLILTMLLPLAGVNL